MSELVFKKNVKELLQEVLVETIRESIVRSNSDSDPNKCPLANRFEGAFTLADKLTACLDGME